MRAVAGELIASAAQMSAHQHSPQGCNWGLASRKLSLLECLGQHPGAHSDTAGRGFASVYGNLAWQHPVPATSAPA